MGDRFFYDLNSAKNGANFSPEQLTQIRKASMARYIIANDITNISQLWIVLAILHMYTLV